MIVKRLETVHEAFDHWLGYHKDVRIHGSTLISRVTSVAATMKTMFDYLMCVSYAFSLKAESISADG